MLALDQVNIDETTRQNAAKIAQSVACLTLVRKVASSSPTAGRLTQPSIPLVVW